MYNKQEWKDEIPDLTKPIMDPSTGKQKTDPQTGRPLFELVQVGTRITSTRLNTMESGIEAAHILVEKLAKEAIGNFVVPVNGVMGLSCSAQGLKATWTAGVAYVGGRRYEVSAGEMALNPTQGQYLYVDVDGVVKKTTSQETAKSGLSLFYVATDTSGVISSTDQRVNISLEEILKRMDNVQIPDASLTQKGKVQLTNAINSTSQTLAATAKAVNDARSQAVTDAEEYGRTILLRLAAEDTATYVNDRPWQKFKLTEDTGYTKWLNNPEMNSLLDAGQFYAYETNNGPVSGLVGNYIEVIRSTSSLSMQRVTIATTGQTFTRYKNSSSTWSAWVLQTPVPKKVWGAL
ncbi:pyocin knob domain-containing protein [Paenibacillus silvae]|uniref:pyocin knob domain-containing protein n=1 Tax=Paenibacillus silvae TaxID=1325358 RepID=UPI003CF1B7FA